MMVSGHKNMTVLALFRNGHDTQQIATLKGITESEVYNALARQRERERQEAEARAYRAEYAQRSRERILEAAL